MIRVCILCYKLVWGNSTLCVSLVLFFCFVRVNAQFVKLNAQFARVNAQFVRENAPPEYSKNALFCVCKTKRTLLPFRRLPVSVYLYNSPKNKNQYQIHWGHETHSEVYRPVEGRNLPSRNYSQKDRCSLGNILEDGSNEPEMQFTVCRAVTSGWG